MHLQRFLKLYFLLFIYCALALLPSCLLSCFDCIGYIYFILLFPSPGLELTLL